MFIASSMKHIITIFSLLMMALLAKAQEDSAMVVNATDVDVRLDKGDFFLGGTLALNLKEAENENQLLRTALNEESNRFSLRLDGAYAIKDNVFVGMGFIWGVTDRVGDYLDPNSGEVSNTRFYRTSYSIRPFIKNHLPLDRNRRFNLVVQTELGFNLNQSIEETDLNQVVTRNLNREWGLNLGVRPGFLAFIIKNFAVEASVNVAGIGFTVQTIEQTDQPDVEITSADLDLRIDLLQLNLGFISYF